MKRNQGSHRSLFPQRLLAYPRLALLRSDDDYYRLIHRHGYITRPSGDTSWSTSLPRSAGDHPERTLRPDPMSGDGPQDLPGVHAKRKVTTQVCPISPPAHRRWKDLTRCRVKRFSE